MSRKPYNIKHKPTDFAKYLTGFISQYLPNERGASQNTITAYRDTFVLLLDYMRQQQQKSIEKLSLADLQRNVIIQFLDWLQQQRACSNSTRNARLAAIHSFFRYVQYELPEKAYLAQQILSIRAKRTSQQGMNYLSVEGIQLLLAQPDTDTKKGRRDLALLSLTYDTGARVQEVIDLTPACLRLGKPPTIQLTGKGNKTRLVPMMSAQVNLLQRYLKEYRLDLAVAQPYPLFSNSRKEKLTRAGINYILQKYFVKAKMVKPKVLPDKMSCHTLRHSKAMHLLQAGVNLVYIRDILGHVSVQTTEIYARADSKHKREALEKAYTNVNPKETPQWVDNPSIIDWLKKF